MGKVKTWIVIKKLVQEVLLQEFVSNMYFKTSILRKLVLLCRIKVQMKPELVSLRINKYVWIIICFFMQFIHFKGKHKLFFKQPGCIFFLNWVPNILLFIYFYTSTNYISMAYVASMENKR